MTVRDAKRKRSLVITERQARMLSGRGLRLGIGISEFLRRVLDDPNVHEAMDRMEPRDESPDAYLKRVAEGGS